MLRKVANWSDSNSDVVLIVAVFTLAGAICSVLLTSIIYVVGGALIGEAGARGALERPWPSTPSAVASEAPIGFNRQNRHENNLQTQDHMPLSQHGPHRVK